MALSPRKRSPIEKWLGQTAIPVFVIAADNTVVYFNEGCEKLTGWNAAEVLGQTCRYSTSAPSSSVESITGAICPPSDVWHGQELHLPAYLTHRHGTSLPRVIHFFPLRGVKDKISSVLGLVGAMKSPLPAGPVSPILQLHAELAAIRGDLRKRFGEQSFLTRAASMDKVLNQLDLAIHSQVQVHLVGKPGTGKEHFARVIHYSGSQKTGWFVPLECARLDHAGLSGPLDRLLEVSTTGAASSGRPQPSTVYLADVERLPRDLQERLSQALKAQKKSEQSPWRLISSGIRPIQESIREGLLHPDFADQLTTLTVELPPLSDRQSDIPVLAQHFLEDLNRKDPAWRTGFADAIWPVFERYHWPGNLDELQIVVQECAAATTDGVIRIADLPFRMRTGLQAQDVPPAPIPLSLPLDEMLMRVETNAIRLALERGRDNKTKAAEMLGINRARLYRRMQQLGIEDREEGSLQKVSTELTEPLPDGTHEPQ